MRSKTLFLGISLSLSLSILHLHAEVQERSVVYFIRPSQSENVLRLFERVSESRTF